MAGVLALVALDASLALLSPVTVLVALEAGAGLLGSVGSALTAVGLVESGLVVGSLSAIAGQMAGLVAVVA